MIANSEMQEFVHDHIVLEPARLACEVTCKRDGAVCGARSPLPHHVLHPDRAGLDAETLGPMPRAATETSHVVTHHPWHRGGWGGSRQ